MHILPTIKAFKDSVSTFDNLPITGNILGDVRKTRDTGAQYWWSLSAASGNLQNWRLISGSTNPETDPESISNIELEFSTVLTNSDSYKELTYSGSKVTLIEIWDSASKVNKLFSKALTYSGSKVTTIVLTRHVDGSTVTKTLTYSGSNVTSVTKIVS